MQVQKARQGYKPVKSYFEKYVEIPDSWSRKSLAEIGELAAGGTPSTFNKDYWENGTISWITSGEVRNNRITESEKKITKLGLDESAARLFPKDSVLVAITGFGMTRGRSSILDINASTNQSVISIITKKEIAYGEFLWHALQNQYWTLRNFAQGTQQPGLNLDILKKFQIMLPNNVEEQQKIASILSNVDSLINQTQKEIEQTQRLKKGLMQKLLTKGIGHTKFKKVNFGGQIDVQIPEEWDVATIEEISVDGTQNGLAISVSDYGRGIPIVGMTKFYASEILSLDNMNEVSISEKDKENFSLRSFDLLFGRRSMDGKATGGAGKCVIIPELKSAIVFESSIIRMSVKKGINPFFIYQLLKSQFGKQLMIRIIRVSAVSGISSGDLRKIKVPIPPKQEQDEIVEILDNFDSQIQRQQQYKSKLEILKKGLMQKLLTGQIRVRV